MLLRWDEFPHYELRLKVYRRLGHNAVGRATEDSVRHILRRALASLDHEKHKRFVELEARTLVEHLRCTRDVYWEFVDSKRCRPVIEAKWVVLRFAVFPTAIAILRQRVIEYAKLTRVAARDLSLLFGIPTRTCYRDAVRGMALSVLPDLEDETAATDDELASLGRLVNENSLFWFRDIRDGGAVGRPVGGGPFSSDDAVAIRSSFSLCGMRVEMTLPEWVNVRNKLWELSAPWTEGLCNLFGSVQEELLEQWRVLPSDSLVQELQENEQSSDFKSVVVPTREKHTKESGGSAGQSAEEYRQKDTPSVCMPNERKIGRKTRLPHAFVICAGRLWRTAISSSKSNVSNDQLLQIGSALDSAGHIPPAAYLEGEYSRDLKDFNSRNSNSKIGPVKTWSQLVSRGDKDHVRGMRRLLSRCAKRMDDPSLSGN